MESRVRKKNEQFSSYDEDITQSRKLNSQKFAVELRKRRRYEFANRKRDYAEVYVRVIDPTRTYQTAHNILTSSNPSDDDISKALKSLTRVLLRRDSAGLIADFLHTNLLNEILSIASNDPKFNDDISAITSCLSNGTAEQI